LSAQYNELTAVAQALSMEVQRIQATQPPPQPGAPPPPPPPQVQQLQKIKQQLQTPQWSQVLELLRNDLSRSYRIDIETNSTVEADATDDKQQIQEVMGAISQLLNGLTPLVTSGALPFQAAQGLLLAVVRRYRFGAEIEDYIKAMQPPKPPDEGNREAEAKLQAEQMQHQQQMAQQALQMQQQKAAMELDKQRQQQELDAMKRELDLYRREIELQIEEERFTARQAIAQEQQTAQSRAMQRTGGRPR